MDLGQRVLYTNGNYNWINIGVPVPTVLVDDSRNVRLFVSSQQKFITGETITGEYLLVPERCSCKV